MKHAITLLLTALAFSANAQTAWISEIKGGGWDDIHDMALDANGNAVVCGRFEGTSDFDPTAGVFNLTSNGGFDGFVAKYDVNGNLLWAGAIGGTEPDILESLAIDDAGNIALYGWFEGTADLDPTGGTQNTTSAGWRDGCVIKLDASGNLVWAFALENTEQCYDGDIAFSPLNGDVLVTGYYKTAIDLDPNGSFVLNVDMDGIVEENTIFLARYDANGALLWGHKLAGNEYPHVSVHADSGAEVINWCVAGIDQSTSPSDLDPGSVMVHPVPGFGNDVMHYMAVAQFDANGGYLWSTVEAVENASAGTNPPDPDLWELETDGDGNILLCGSIHKDYSVTAGNQTSISHIGLGRDGFALKYDPTGTLLWEKVIGGPQITTDEAVSDVSVDADGNIWLVTGLSTGADVNLGGTPVPVGTLQESDIVVVRYDPNGNYLWHGIAGGDWYDSGMRIAFWNGDAVLAGSYATNGGTADLDITAASTSLTAIGLYDGFITRFTPSITTGVADVNSDVTIAVYPNPCTDVLYVQATGPYEVRDMAGRVVMSGTVRGGAPLDVGGLTAGVYTFGTIGRIARFTKQH